MLYTREAALQFRAAMAQTMTNQVSSKPGHDTRGSSLGWIQ
jgi:hypothetical protein